MRVGAAEQRDGPPGHRNNTKVRKMSGAPRLNVAMIGHGFMGHAHSQGWRVAPRFFDLQAEPTMGVVVGRNAETVAEDASRWGWAEHATDWRSVIERDDIDIVDI